MTSPLRYGIFLPPFHALNEDPTLAIHRDLELMEWVDKLGYDEAWIGEHHSGGQEIIGSPELFIAAAAERTTRLRLGTGVVSLPYHNPLMVASRIVQLDHMTRGRIMFGAGPGLLASDAMQMGIDPMDQRDIMARALDVIIRLFKGESVTEKTAWYELVDAKLHLKPYSYPYPEIAVASSLTPSGGKIAAKYGLAMLCVAATTPTGFDVLATNWQTARETAAKFGNVMDPSRLRIVAPIHIAETREQARKNVEFGFKTNIAYFNNHQTRYPIPAGADPVDWFVDNGYGVIGTPDDAIDLIKRVKAKQGDFGYFLLQAHNWADWAQTKRSYELFARYVVPHFSKANEPRESSYAWNGEHKDTLESSKVAAVKAAFAQHERSQQPES